MRKRIVIMLSRNLVHRTTSKLAKRVRQWICTLLTWPHIDCFSSVMSFASSMRCHQVHEYTWACWHLYIRVLCTQCLSKLNNTSTYTWALINIYIHDNILFLYCNIFIYADLYLFEKVLWTCASARKNERSPEYSQKHQTVNAIVFCLCKLLAFIGWHEYDSPDHFFRSLAHQTYMVFFTCIHL